MLGLGAVLRVVRLRRVCLFVGGYFVEPFGKFVKKEMKRKYVGARGWVRIGARRAEAQRGVWWEGKCYR